MNDQIISLIVIVCAFTIILSSIILVVKKLRGKAREQAAAINASKSKAECGPPVHTVTMSSSRDSFPMEMDAERPGLSRSASDRLDINLWEFRKDQRRQFILENLDYKTVTSKMFKVLDLPHTSILSQRSNKITAKKDKSLQSKEVGSRMIDTLSTGGDTISCSHSLSRLRGSKNTTEYTNVSCPICVEKYKEGDAICWSRNELCVHAYHLECKIGFLMNTDECILCRRSFLQGGCEQ